MSGGWLAGVQSPGVSYTLKTAVTKAGTLVKKTTVAGEMDTCGAGDKPHGYTMGTTYDVFGTAQAGVKGAVLPLIPGNVIEVPVLSTNAAIAVGDELETTAGGTVDLKSGAGEIVGVALGAVAQNTGGFVEVLVYQRTAAA